MVILIAGGSHTGKTVLAQRILEERGWPYLSIDHLKMGLIRSGYTHLTPSDDDELTAYLWPIVREMAKTAIENGLNLVIEGCYIPFDWAADFDSEYLAHIRAIWLVMTEDYIRAHFPTSWRTLPTWNSVRTTTFPVKPCSPRMRGICVSAVSTAVKCC